jgi:hypothetical protein
MDKSVKVLTRNGYPEDESKGGMEEEPDEDLTVAEAKAYRMLAARLNYMAQDNPLIQYTAKEVCKAMSNPKVQDFHKVKKAIRFLKGLESVKWHFCFQTEAEAMQIEVYVDSDWAGCKRTRKSTSGGVLMLGTHPLRTWASTQPTIATSTGEAELISLTEGASRGLGLKTVLEELDLKVSLHVLAFTDSSVAKSFAATRGLGRMRHLSVKALWLQEAVQHGRLTVKKVRGPDNPADALTKFQDLKTLSRLLGSCGFLVVPITGGDRAEGGCWNQAHLGPSKG